MHQQFERPLLVRFPAMHIRINGHSPEQDRTGRHFNETIDSKSHERNTSRNNSRHDRNQTLERIPHHREIFESSSAKYGSWAFQGVDCGHADSLATTAAIQCG